MPIRNDKTRIEPRSKAWSRTPPDIRATLPSIIPLPLPSPPSSITPFFHHPPLQPSFGYLTLTQETGNALVTTLGQRMSMDGNDYLLSERINQDLQDPSEAHNPPYSAVDHGWPEFKCGRKPTIDDLRSRHPTTVVTEEMVKKWKNCFSRSSCRSTFYCRSDKDFFDSAHSILHERLEMKKYPRFDSPECLPMRKYKPG
ncbi:hypothetical protein EVAR_94124_1 [Eumeta japonica]|uniref:Uncharacterized protein n=1 Tax=Eumeta variegata TaxID=151549 RepID=A0A4C1U6T7_EUMVA|nr:hypothetical protein EVAR_94124_1 [Eumeta japonica]